MTNESNVGDGGAEQVADKLHEEQEKGYTGFVPDTHPNSDYTVAGVLKLDKGRGTEPEQQPSPTEEPES